MDEGEQYFTLIEKEEDLALPLLEGVGGGTPPDLHYKGRSEKLALLTQTTLSVDDTASLITKIQERFPDIVLPKAGDICYATTNRQKAVKVLAEQVDVVLVVGSKNSSNSSKLRHVAEDMGKHAYLIDSREDIDRVWFESISSV